MRRSTYSTRSAAPVVSQLTVCSEIQLQQRQMPTWRSTTSRLHFENFKFRTFHDFSGPVGTLALFLQTADSRLADRTVVWLDQLTVHISQNPMNISRSLATTINSGHARPTIDHGWPGIPCRRSAGMEQLAIIRPSYNIARHLPARTEDIFTPFELCWLPSRLSSLYQPSLSIPLWLCKVPLLEGTPSRGGSGLRLTHSFSSPHFKRHFDMIPSSEKKRPEFMRRSTYSTRSAAPVVLQLIVCSESPVTIATDANMTFYDFTVAFWKL